MKKKVPVVEPDLTNLGAGILGMYAAIRICLHNDIDPYEFCDMILREVWPERKDLYEKRTAAQSSGATR